MIRIIIISLMQHKIQKIKRKLIELLSNSQIGLSGTEISNKLNINRVTMTKYLNIFVSEGLIKQIKIGNANLWFIESGIMQFDLPDDYFKIKNKYLDHVLDFSNRHSINLIRSLLHSDSHPTKIILEIIIPTIHHIQKLYVEKKINRLYIKLYHRIIMNSINLMNSLVNDIDFNKNILIISDIQNTLQAEAASTSFTANNWNVSFLGDISDAIDVLFDIDLQKFFHKIMTDKELMLVLVFVESYEKLKFFSETLKGIKKKFNNDIFLMLFYDDVNVDVDADLITNDLKIVFQWADTKITSMSKWAE